MLASSLLAQQNSVWTIGLRAGADLVTDKAQPTTNLGPAASLELGYSHYWVIGNHVATGLRTGLSAGYHSVSNHAGYEDAYSRYDYYGNQMDYTISADRVNRQVRCLTLGVPLMWAWRFGGASLDVGTRAQLPLLGKVSQSVDNLHLSAYYPAYSVLVPDELIIGNVTEAMLHQQTTYTGLPTVSVLGSAELGYNWSLPSGGEFGLGVYADVEAWSYYKQHPAAAPSPLIDVANITNKVYPVPDVTIHIRPLGEHTRYMSFGITAHYSFVTSRRTSSSHSHYPCRCYTW